MDANFTFITSGFDTGSTTSNVGGGKDAELQSFLMLEQQKAQMQSMVSFIAEEQSIFYWYSNKKFVRE